jgi:hypothetical protein
MILRRWFPRWRRRAPGQLMFWFVLSPVPIYWTPPEPPQRARPAPRPNAPSWRPRRARRECRHSQDRRDRQVDRWLRRGAACALCKRWPAPHDHLVHGRLLLLCKSCESQPDSLVRLTEIVLTDWRKTPDPAESVPERLCTY